MGKPTGRLAMAYQTIARLETENNRLRSRVAELERDAARYRWLREQDAEKGIAVLNITGWERAATCLATTYPDAASLDDAIDAAMAAQQDGEGVV